MGRVEEKKGVWYVYGACPVRIIRKTRNGRYEVEYLRDVQSSPKRNKTAAKKGDVRLITSAALRPTKTR